MKFDFENEPLRKRYQELEAREGLTLGDVAVRCNWVSPKGKPDSTRVARQLGIVGERGQPPKEHTTVEYALKMCAALHLDPLDIGL